MTARAYSAAELAGAPGMPATDRSVHRLATAKGWAFVEETTRGGTRRLYLAEQLPAATRAALAWNQPQPLVVEPTAVAASAGRSEGARLALRSGLDAKAAQARRQSGLHQAAELDAASQARMDAKLAVLRAFELWSQTCCLPPKQARTAFCLAYNDGSLEVPAGVRALVAQASAKSLERWHHGVRQQGITALAGAYGNRAGTGKLDRQPQLREFVQAMLVQHPHARCSHVMKLLQSRFGGAAALPSSRALQRWVDEWRHQNRDLLLALANPDEWKNKQRVAFGSYAVQRLNERWELDSSPADVMLTDGRHSIIAGIDVYSRRVRMVVAKTSKATAVAALLRVMLLDFGVPECIKTDNGSDYTSAHITRVIHGLEIEHRLCAPFTPMQKPYIERFFGTFTRDMVELLAGFIGHDVAQRKAIEARKSFADRLMQPGKVVEAHMSGADLQRFCDEWTDSVYLHAPHSGDDMQGATPFERYATWTDELRRITDERALDILLAEAPDNKGTRTVQKKGVRVDDAWFIAPELEAWVGSQVQVRYDAIQHDLGRIYVFGDVPGVSHMEFVCVAQCPERTGVDRREIAAKALALQKQRVQEGRRLMRAHSKKVLGKGALVDELLRDKAAKAGKLALLSRAAVGHTSVALNATAKAASAADKPLPDVEQLQQLQAARARIAAEQIPQGTPNELAEQRLARNGGFDTPEFESRHARVEWLLRQLAHRELGGEEREYLALYKRELPASYHRLKDMVAEQLGSAKENDPGRLERGTGSD